MKGVESFTKFPYRAKLGHFACGDGNFVKNHVQLVLNFTAKFPTMAEKKIVKKAYAVMQDALFEKDGTGAYKPREMAKEGMNTLKKHSTNLIVICTDSSKEDMTDLLSKNGIPFDKVTKLDESFDFIIMGEDNTVRAYTWEGALENIGWKLTHEPEHKPDLQQKADSSLEHFFKKVKGDCPCCG